VYRGQSLPQLQGGYLFGDFGSSTIWILKESTPGVWSRETLAKATEPISSFGEDEAGELYVVGYSGTVFRLDPAPAAGDASGAAR
jgi:hypothetical protein